MTFKASSKLMEVNLSQFKVLNKNNQKLVKDKDFKINLK
jgi:hypothetical protein